MSNSNAPPPAPTPPSTVSLSRGASLLKLGRGYMGPHKRTFILNKEASAITWKSTR